MASKRIWRIVGFVAAGLLLVVAIAAIAFTWWALTPYGPDEAALEALVSDDIVTVEETDSAWTFSPASDAPRMGVVLYPGGRVDARAYAPLARELAEQGYLVAITPMPLNLAVFAPDRAQDVVDEYPEMMAWAVGGHSLGGTMAARYANANRDTVEALALLASYPAGGDDMSDSELAALTIYGTKDGVLNEDNFEEATPLLPPETRFVPIEGGNHAQFGNYGEQAGDGEATILAEDQRWVTVTAMAEMLNPIRRRLPRAE
jgi:pimeloyl-ACP methyl ester carboxylesterase